MPTVSVWLVRASLVHLALGATLGAALLTGKVAEVPAWIWVLRPLHVEILLFGFVIQLAFGVAWWILPRTPERKPTRLPWVAGVLLNAGLWVVGLVPFAGWPGEVFLLGRVVQAVALVVFARSVWPRIREFRG
ncbi:MAG: hypothetical protein ACI80V_003038 [Rhodothermales bacterium]|jgi:hypothetical protein